VKTSNIIDENTLSTLKLEICDSGCSVNLETVDDSISSTNSLKKFQFKNIKIGENSLTRSFITCILRMIMPRRMRRAWHVAGMCQQENAYRILVGKPKGKRPLGSLRHRWKDNNKMDRKEIEWGGMDWIDLVQKRKNWRALVYTVMNIWGSINFGNFLSS
jgi:hypothetical protein